MTPQDRAERIIHDLDYKPPEQWRGRVYELVIAAIMDAVGEERERCAKIAEWYILKVNDPSIVTAIANEIREGL